MSGSATEVPEAPSRFRLGQGLWVYVLMLAAALVGIGYTNTGGPDTSGLGPRISRVWIAVVPIYFLACVWHGWAGATERGERTRLIVTQALHWFAFVAAMYIVLQPEVRGVINDDSVGLLLLTLLAMGTFIAGVHAWSVPICVVGLILGLMVPALAWVEESTLLLLVIAGGLGLAVVVGVVLWRRFSAGRATSPV